MNNRLFGIFIALFLPVFVYANTTEENHVGIVQKATTNDYHFSVDIPKANCCKYYVEPFNINIIDNNINKVIQTIPVETGMTVTRSADEVINLVDVNFDGYPDISLLVSDHRETVENIYLYKPNIGKFSATSLVFANMRIDANTETITSSSSTYPQGYVLDKYAFIKDKLTLVESIQENYDFSVIKTRSRNGEMQSTTQFSETNGETAVKIRKNTLCREDEAVYFSCNIENSKKIASLCGDIGTANWVQFRMGEPHDLNVIYPRDKQNSLSKFQRENAEPSISFAIADNHYILMHGSEKDHTFYQIKRKDRIDKAWNDLRCMNARGDMASISKALIGVEAP